MIWTETLAYPYEPASGDPKELGLYLILRKNEEGFIQMAELGLINFSNLAFTFELKFPDLDQLQCSDWVKGHQIQVIKGLPEDWYHEKRPFEVSAARVHTAGQDPVVTGSVKIRNKHLVQADRFDALLNAHIILLAAFPWKQITEVKELKEIAKQQADSVIQTRRKTIAHNDPLQKANFPSVLDLHVQQLREDTKGMSSTEILMLQLDKFDRFLDEALRLNIDQIFVIHGIGKGRLKEEIFRRLKNHPHVRNYKNEFHPKYKFGATEIELG
jgi:hypothetical protein